MVEFPQPSADLLPSGLGEISLRRHQKLVSAENPNSVAITHPLGCARRLRNARGGAWRDACTWGGSMRVRAGAPGVDLSEEKELLGSCLLSGIPRFGVNVSSLAGPLFHMGCFWLLTP